MKENRELCFAWRRRDRDRTRAIRFICDLIIELDVRYWYIRRIKDLMLPTDWFPISSARASFSRNSLLGGIVVRLLQNFESIGFDDPASYRLTNQFEQGGNLMVAGQDWSSSVESRSDEAPSTRCLRPVSPEGYLGWIHDWNRSDNWISMFHFAEIGLPLSKALLAPTF